MNLLYNIINRINFLLEDSAQRLKIFSEEELSFKASENKWSKKEILGHLCDSAINNLSRFIRAQFETEPVKMTGYEQNDWVQVNHYQQMDIDDIIDLWVTLNKRIVFVVSKIPDEKLAAQCELDDISFRTPGKDKSLFWLIEDYLIHVEHHLKQLGVLN